jgi:predicted methyltransferase
VNQLISKIKEHNKDLKNREIEGILYLLISNHGISSMDLIKATGLPKETLRIFKTSISHLLEKNDEDRLQFTEESLKVLRESNLRPYDWSTVKYANAAAEAGLVDIRKKYKLQPKREFDQFFATESTSIAKTMVMENKLGLENKDVVLLGDDDLISIALPLLGIKPKSVTVLDIDKDLLSVIEDITADMGINNTHTSVYDFRKDPDKNLLNKFDVVVTDPPYTSSGVKLFLNRGVQLLKKKDDHSGSYIFFYYGNSFKSPEKTLKVQDIIGRFNLVIEDKIDKFARYNGAESIGSASSLYVLKSTSSTFELSDLSDYSDIYTYSSTSEEKFPYVDHFTFKLYNVPANMLKSKTAIFKAAGDFCTRHKLKVVDQKVTKFKGQGLTVTYVLSNSNLLLHTWPEHGALHVDLVTCSPIYDKEGLSYTLMKVFGAKSIDTRKIE